MTPETAEATLYASNEDKRLYALAPLTPGVTYTPGPMYDTVLGHMSHLGVDADVVHDIVRMFVTAALLCPGAMDGDIVQITALRLTKPAEPEEERPEV